MSYQEQLKAAKRIILAAKGNSDQQAALLGINTALAKAAPRRQHVDSEEGGRPMVGWKHAIALWWFELAKGTKPDKRLRADLTEQLWQRLQHDFPEVLATYNAANPEATQTMPEGLKGRKQVVTWVRTLSQG